MKEPVGAQLLLPQTTGTLLVIILLQLSCLLSFLLYIQPPFPECICQTPDRQDQAGQSKISTRLHSSGMSLENIHTWCGETWLHPLLGNFPAAPCHCWAGPEPKAGRTVNVNFTFCALSWFLLICTLLLILHLGKQEALSQFQGHVSARLEEGAKQYWCGMWLKKICGLWRAVAR